VLDANGGVYTRSDLPIQDWNFAALKDAPTPPGFAAVESADWMLYEYVAHATESISNPPSLQEMGIFIRNRAGMSQKVSSARMGKARYFRGRKRLTCVFSG
jgi:hypothetical protein